MDNTSPTSTQTATDPTAAVQAKTNESVFNIPNQLTLARLFAAPVLFALIAYHLWIASIVVFALAALSDWLDGYLARKWNQTSVFGRNLDPLIDKVIVCGSYIFLIPIAGAGLVPWMVSVVVARELLITGLRGYMESTGASFGADWLGKIKMILQSATLFALFFLLIFWDPDTQAFTWSAADILRDSFIYAMLAATILSGLQYGWRAFHLLRAAE